MTKCAGRARADQQSWPTRCVRRRRLNHARTRSTDLICLSMNGGGGGGLRDDDDARMDAEAATALDEN